MSTFLTTKPFDYMAVTPIVPEGLHLLGRRGDGDHVVVAKIKGAIVELYHGFMWRTGYVQIGNVSDEFPVEVFGVMKTGIDAGRQYGTIDAKGRSASYGTKDCVKYEKRGDFIYMSWGYTSSLDNRQYWNNNKTSLAVSELSALISALAS